MAIVNVGMGRHPWKMPTFRGGTAEFVGNAEQGYVVIKSSGWLKFPGSGIVDRVQTGSGLAGARAGSATSGAQSGGDGGDGGGLWYRNSIPVKRNVEYWIEVATECSSNTEANTSSSFDSSTTTSGRGASGGTKGIASTTSTTNATAGGAANKQPWSSNNPIPALGKFGAGGGGGGAWLRQSNQTYSANAGAGGSPGGGAGGVYSTTHTSGNGYDADPYKAAGGGGGGRRYGDTPEVRGYGGKGGTGIVIVRWGY